jgi:hypothetical protein
VARLLAYVTGLMNQQLLLQKEYLIAERTGFYARICRPEFDWPMRNDQL